MNDIEKINVAPDSYFQRIVKPCLLDLRKRKDNAKTDMERGTQSIAASTIACST